MRTEPRAVFPDGYLALGLAAPAALAGVVLLLAWTSREGAEGAARGWLGALAVGGAYALGHAAVFGGVPDLPPHQSSDAIFWLAPAAAAQAALAGVLHRWPAARRAVYALFPFFVPWLLLRRAVAGAEVLEASLLVGGLGLAIALVWWALRTWSERRPGPSAPLVLWWTTCAVAFALTLSGSAKLGFFAGILAAVLGACAVVAWLRPTFSAGAGVSGVVVAVEAGLLIAGVWFSRLPDASAALLALAPLAAWAVEWGPLARLAPRRAVLARLVAVTLLALPAVLLAWAARPAPYAY